MGFHTDDQMRRFVNNNRALFLASLHTTLFLEEYLQIHTSTRQQIRCRSRNDGDYAANSLLLDAIMRQEDFAYKFISFCKKKGQCLELAKLLKEKLVEIGSWPREGLSRNRHRDPPALPGSGASPSGQRDDRSQSQQRHREREQTKTELRQNRGEPNHESQLNAQGMSELSPPQAESSSWSSSFWVDSALVAGLPDEAEEEEHALNLKQVDLQPEGVLENMVNIPPSLTNNTRVGAVQPVKIVPSKFSGMQCQEDVEKFQEDTEGRGYAYGIVGNDDNHIQDPHETQRKSVYVGDNSDARESNVQNSKQVTYFEISPLDVLGMSKDTHKTTSSYASVQNGAYDAEDEITDASDRYSEGFSLPNIKVKIGNIDALNVTEAAGISSPTASDHTAEEEALGNEYVSHAPQTAGEAEAETMSSSPSNTDGDEDQSDALEEEISDEENPNENLGANEEAGTIFTAPLRAAAMVVNGVRAVLRATHGYWNYNRTN